MLVVIVIGVAAYAVWPGSSAPTASSPPTPEPPARSGTLVLRAENYGSTPKIVALYIDANGYEPQNNFDWDWMSVSDCPASGDVYDTIGGSIMVKAHGVAWMTCEGLALGTRWVLVCSPSGNRLFTTTVDLSPENPWVEVTANLP